MEDEKLAAHQQEDIVSDCELIGRDLPDKKYDTFSTIVNNNIFLVIPKFA